MNFCTETANIWQLVGYVLLIFKIVIPLLLIIFGMLDLGKAVIGSKEDETKKAINSLIRRLVAAVIIFFIPTLVSFAIGLVDGWGKNDDVKNQYNICRQCITNPGKKAKSGDNNKYCGDYAQEAWDK